MNRASHQLAQNKGALTLERLVRADERMQRREGQILQNEVCFGGAAEMS